MKNIFSMKSTIIVTVTAFVLFMLTRGDKAVDYMWISFIFSILGMIITLNLKHERSRLRPILFYLNLFYTVGFGLVYIYLWCAFYAGPFPEWH